MWITSKFGHINLAHVSTIEYRDGDRAIIFRFNNGKDKALTFENAEDAQREFDLIPLHINSVYTEGNGLSL